jgi:hypothetical protein
VAAHRARAGPAMPVIGFLYFGWPDTKMVAAFQKGLNETGYVEGRNVASECRYANNEDDRLAELAADLIRREMGTFRCQKKQSRILPPGIRRA